MKTRNLMPLLSRSPLQCLCLWGLAALAGCTPPPQTRHRVDFTLDPQGHCQVNHQPQPCAQAGAVALQLSPQGGSSVSAVLLVSPQSPIAAQEALIGSLRAAKINHLQYGDPPTNAQRPQPKGAND
jgi:hypothetical protein